MKKIIFFYFLSLILSACIKEKCRLVGGTYEFEVPATLTPSQDTFRVGDTITITSSFSDMVYERKTDTWYKLENFKFFPGTELKRIDVTPVEEGLLSFEILIDTSIGYHVTVFSEGTIALIGEYKYHQNEYSLKFQLIAKEPGLFYMEQSIFPLLAKNQNFEGKCSNLENDGVVKMNNGANNNIEMLLSSPDPHFNTWIPEDPESRFHRFGGYCFRVVP